MSAHTPGPWKAGRTDMQSYCGMTGEPFTNIYHATMKDGEHHVTGDALPLVIAKAVGEGNKANARLIAAAPDMLAALKAVQEYGHEDSPKKWEIIQAAIDKAEGRA